MVRIRKNLQVSPLVFCSNAAPEDFQPHICRLNQSRWDVSPLIEFEAEDGFNLKGSGTIGATSVALPSRMDIEKVIIDVEEGSKEVDEGNEFGFQKKKMCQKNDGKKWKCSKEVKDGYSFCKHHMNLIRAYQISNAPMPSHHLSRSPRWLPERLLRLRQKRGSLKPNDYVYCSIFSPHRKKDRRTIAEEENAKNIAVENGATTSSTSAVTPKYAPPSPKADYENRIAYVDVNEENVDGSNVCGRKRMRKMKKPVKAKSL